MPKTPEAPRHVGALNRNRILPETAARKRWCVTPPAGSLPEDLCSPDYWKHVVAEIGLKANDLVDATCEAGTWFATYLVIHVGPTHAKLQILNEYSLEEASDLAKRTETHEVRWKGPAHKYVVRRLSDGETVKHGFDSEAAAAAWMHRETRNIAAAA